MIRTWPGSMAVMTGRAPWNDRLLHHYHFTVYALDVDRLALEGPFTGADARAAMQGHVLAQATHVGTYSMNPDVR